jgi:hypothetical protein
LVWKGLKETSVDPKTETPAVAPVVEAVKETLDVNKDGKVDLKDVKDAGQAVVKKARKPRAKKVQ